MKKLDEKVVALLNSQVAWDLATFDTEPNVAPMAFKAITPDGQLAIANVFMVTTVANVLKNGKMAISAYDAKTMEGYQLKGTAVYETSGPHFDKLAAVVAEKLGGMPIGGVILFTPEQVIVTTPGPDNKKEL